MRTTYDPMLGVVRQQDAGDQIYGLIGYDERVIPALRRYSGNPVFKVSAQNPASGALSPTTSSTIYWPYIVNAGATGVNAMDKFYMYYSTDHDGGSGGIWLASAPTPLGPWKGRGRVYVDTSSGAQTETPSVIWNDDENLFFMYYQQAGASGSKGVQSTCLATSPNGVNWTRVGIAIDQGILNSFPGDGHTGYFRPFKAGRQWYGYHLMGGGNYPHFAISYSSNGRGWMIDPRPLGYGSDQFTDGRRIEWNSGDPVWWRGQLWWVGICSNFSSGSTPKDARIAIAPLTNDFRHLVGKPYYQLYPAQGTNESANYRALQAFTWNGKLIVTYQCDGNFNVAMAG